MEIKLNHANVISQAVKWKNDNNVASNQLKEVIDDMTRSNAEVKFYLVKYLVKVFTTSPLKNRYHKYLQSYFEFRIGIHKEFDMTWMDPPKFKKPKNM